MSNGRQQNRNKYCLIWCGFSSYKKLSENRRLFALHIFMV